jgi:hypothetical protein
MFKHDICFISILHILRQLRNGNQKTKNVDHK